MKGFAGFVELHELEVAVGDVFLAVGEGDVMGFLSGGHGIGELAVFSISGGECADEKGDLITGLFAGVLGEEDSLLAVAQMRIGISGQNPGEIVQGEKDVGVQFDDFAVVRNGFGIAAGISQEHGKVELGLSQVRLNVDRILKRAESLSRLLSVEVTLSQVV